jgi:hypothetical protein
MWSTAMWNDEKRRLRIARPMLIGTLILATLNMAVWIVALWVGCLLYVILDPMDE